MTHDHNSAIKYDIASHASLPMLLMLFIEIALNYYFAPANSIFISPYLLAFFIFGLISFLVYLKGDICPGQKGRLTFVLGFLLIFALGNLIYTLVGTPKHTPMIIASLASLFFPLIYFRLPQDESLYRTILACGFAIVAIGIIQYLIIYWFELPSLFNWFRANNFAQLLLGILLSGWYLMLAKSRLEQFLKVLVKLAIIVLVLNYFWSIYVLLTYIDARAELNLFSISFYAVSQFIILAMLGWLLLGKNIKNPTAWTVATLFAMCYPLANLS